MNEYNSVVIGGKQVIGGYRAIDVNDEVLYVTSSNDLVRDFTMRYYPELCMRNIDALVVPNNNVFISMSLFKNGLNTIQSGTIEIKYTDNAVYSYVIKFSSNMCSVSFSSNKGKITFFQDKLSDTSYDSLKKEISQILNIIKTDLNSRGLTDIFLQESFIDVIFSTEGEVISYLSDLANNVTEEERKRIRTFLDNYGCSLGRGKILSD